jgi:hypothetical protein
MAQAPLGLAVSLPGNHRCHDSFVLPNLPAQGVAGLLFPDSLAASALEQADGFPASGIQHGGNQLGEGRTGRAAGLRVLRLCRGPLFAFRH